MWPWEHLAFGYLCVTGCFRVVADTRPDERDAVLLAVGTQLPDLIDKPLGWGLGVLPGGLALGHSLLFAAVTTAVAVTVAARFDATLAGVALTVGHASHLLGDVLFGLLTGGYVSIGFLFWPFVERPPSTRSGLFGTTLELFQSYLAFLGTPRGATYLVVEFLLLGGALLAWHRDGRPGLALLRRWTVDRFTR